MEWTIYCHTHTETQRRYIGQTRLTMERRWKGHVSNSRRTKRHWGHFARAIAKYGPDAFTHEVLEVCVSQDDANEAERAWIAHFASDDKEHGFNLSKGGTQPFDVSKENPWLRPDYRARQLATTVPKALASMHTPEAAAKRRATKTTPEFRQKCSDIFKSVLKRPEVQEKIKATRETPEYKARQKAAQRVRTHCPKGHEYTPENGVRYTTGGLRCRQCHRDQERKRMSRASP